MKFVVQNTTKSFCKYCSLPVDLLAPETALRGPMFYICWACKKIFQAGVGEVKRESVS